MRSSMYMLLAALAVLASCGDNIRSGPSIETTLEKNQFTAGEIVDPTCEIFDSGGTPMTDPATGAPLADVTELTITYLHADSFGEDEGGNVIAQRAGFAHVRCAAPELGLVDETPELIEIHPGAAIRVVTQLDADTAYAGQEVGARCLGFDQYDNPVLGVPSELAMTPTGSGVTITPTSVAAQLAGPYDVRCVVTGIDTVDDASLFVLPALPATIQAHLEPERQVYAVDQQVTVIADAYDIFGNRVDEATFSYTTAPTIPSPSEAAFRFAADGSYTITATVTSATHEDLPLSVAIPVIVNTTGPAIECKRLDDPATTADSYMIQQAPSTISLPVRVSDAFTVQSVTVNGVAATLGGNGNYTAAVPIGFGMNFYDIVARDEHGLENSTTCFVLAGSTYTPEDAFMNGGVALRLDPRAISDSDPSVIDSLNDILQTVLRSDRLRQLVDAGLRATNLNNGGCNWYNCEPEANYRGGSLAWNTPSSSLALITDGLRVAVSIPNVRATVDVCGSGCCPGGTTVNITVSRIDATVDFRLFLQNGFLRASVNGTPNVTVGTVSLNGSGFCGFIAEQLAGIFENAIRREISEALQGYIQSDLGPILDQFVSSIDVNTLGTSFNVPRLDGTGSITLGFNLSLASLDIVPARLLLGLGTRFTPTTVGQNRSSLGIAMRTPSALLDPPGTSSTRPVGLAFYEGVMNQVLHGLWRGGFFAATLQLGEGTAIIDGKLPAVVAFSAGNRADLMLGGIAATITVPGIVTDMQVTFGGRASATVALAGNDLSFSQLTITELYASFGKPLTQNQRNALEDFLRDVLQSVLIDAISDGLPAIPIPSFTLPPSVGPFGLPAGAQLGIVNPVLNTVGSHFVLTGSFGRRN